MQVYFDSDLDAATVLEFGVPRVVVATGARWRADGLGHHRAQPMPIAAGARVLTPDDIMQGTVPPAGARVVVWDDDHYYMGGVIAELLADKGCETGLPDAGLRSLHMDPEHDGAAPSSRRGSWRRA